MAGNNTITDKSNFTTLPGIPSDQKLTASEFNELKNFQQTPTQPLTEFVDTDITIDGTKEYSTTKVIAGATHTITASDDDAVPNVLSSEHKQGNYIKVRYQFDVDCTVTLTNLEATGNNIGSITPIKKGTYDLIFIANARGINLTIPQNLIKETIKVPLGARGTDHTTGTNKIGFHVDYDFYLEAVTLEFDPVASGAGPTGAAFIVDINVANIDGTSLATILSTKLSVDTGEYHSSTAVTAAVISTNTIAKYKFISIDIDQTGITQKGQGGFVTLNGYRT
jgi:hypothetical protein